MTRRIGDLVHDMVAEREARPPSDLLNHDHPCKCPTCESTVTPKEAPERFRAR